MPSGLFFLPCRSGASRHFSGLRAERERMVVGDEEHWLPGGLQNDADLADFFSLHERSFCCLMSFAGGLRVCLYPPTVFLWSSPSQAWSHGRTQRLGKGCGE